MHCRLWASPSCFFRVLLITIFLSRRHLALAAVLPTRSSSSEEPSSSAAYSVAWSGPAPGDRFGSGDTIVGEWQVTPQDQKIVSPSFRLCTGEDGCGTTIWPEVVKKSEGSYYVSLTAPSVTTESRYYLQMKDDFGHTYSSPIFDIGSAPQKKNKPAAHSPDVAQPRPDQAPMSSSPSSTDATGNTGTESKGTTTDSNPAAAAAAAGAAAPPPAVDPNGILSPPNAATSLLSPNSAATSTPSGSTGGNGRGPHVAAAGHNAPPVAAIAVPLSLTGAIILLAGGLALHHRKQLAVEKERASCSSSSWPWWNKDASGRSQAPGLAAAAEKAFFARAGAALFRGGTVSLLDRTRDDDVYHHRHHRDRGHFPEKAASSMYSSYYAPSSYGCSAPLAEPRQRTREFDLLTREFTRPTRTRTRPHPCAYPPTSPSPSPSSYRGLWDRRFTLRRSTRSSNANTTNGSSGSGGGGGSGSLWRSLSFAARQKKVLPPTPHSPSPSPLALNSPTMTVVTTTESVTSDVLPSYLPSPQFDGPGPRGDFGFENVPLSPPPLSLPLPPPPLHTRGEAADDSDDLRMKELRGVYEAVARALGSTYGV